MVHKIILYIIHSFKVASTDVGCKMSHVSLFTASGRIVLCLLKVRQFPEV